jgi:hypothetical protein
MKDSVICVRISSTLRAALERISVSERRSLSAAIENILYEHLEGKGGEAAGDEKRKFPRRAVSTPALVQTAAGPFAATVRDISLGGIGLSAGAGYQSPVQENSRLAVVFTLPETTKPLLMQCVARRCSDDKPPHIGASFAEDGHQGYAALRNYLMQ